MTAIQEQRISEWIHDAGAIVRARISGRTPAETKVRAGFEALIHRLGALPRDNPGGSGGPPADDPGISTPDLRHIVKALDACLDVFRRHDRELNTPQRRIQILVRATRRFAEEELHARGS